MAGTGRREWDPAGGRGRATTRRPIRTARPVCVHHSRAARLGAEAASRRFPSAHVRPLSALRAGPLGPRSLLGGIPTSRRSLTDSRTRGTARDPSDLPVAVDAVDPLAQPVHAYLRQRRGPSSRAPCAMPRHTACAGRVARTGELRERPLREAVPERKVLLSKEVSSARGVDGARFPRRAGVVAGDAEQPERGERPRLRDRRSRTASRRRGTRPRTT